LHDPNNQDNKNTPTPLDKTFEFGGKSLTVVEGKFNTRMWCAGCCSTIACTPCISKKMSKPEADSMLQQKAELLYQGSNSWKPTYGTSNGLIMHVDEEAKGGAFHFHEESEEAKQRARHDKTDSYGLSDINESAFGRTPNSMSRTRLEQSNQNVVSNSQQRLDFSNFTNQRLAQAAYKPTGSIEYPVTTLEVANTQGNCD
jgi:hypothetical protein